MNFPKLAESIIELLKSGTSNSLEMVKIHGNREGYYFDLVRKKMILIKSHSEIYFLPLEPDENNNCYLFLPYTFNSGAIILVPLDDVEVLGFN